jgi:linoleoyl-CoA desaturase
VLTGNLAANLNRNLWSFAIIFCGHFTEDADTFPESVLENETRGSWYLRQLRGSSNLTGGKLLHFMSGNLSHQIEHHLFPDVPAMRYAEMSGKVRAICEKYGQHYNTGSFGKQLAGVAKRILRYSLPNGAAEPKNHPVPLQVVRAVPAQSAGKKKQPAKATIRKIAARQVESAHA